MAILFADTFFQAINKLQAKETAKAIDFVTRFQANPKNPGISLERLNTPSKDLWSGRITQELRCILLQLGADWALLFAGHHDAAYLWAERRTVGRHPVTGMIEVVERVEFVEEVREVADQPEALGIFHAHDDAYLLSLGIPENWLPTLRKVRNDDQLLVVAGKMPAEVAERLLLLATGEFVTPPEPVAATASPAEHPDTRRRFFVAHDAQELVRALEAPMEEWVAFLHPTQRNLAQGVFSGPTKVTGSAGTGKTVVALHRARHLARSGKKVLVTSYVRTLCENIEHSLKILCSPDEVANIAVSTLHSEALRLVKSVDRRIRSANDETIDQILREEARRGAEPEKLDFVLAEWKAVIVNHGLRTWPEYRQVKRTGRGTALSTAERKKLWSIFSRVQQRLEQQHELDWPGLCRRAAEWLEDGTVTSEFDAVIVDEVQDLGRPELLLVRALAKRSPQYLMVVGDAGQRIYPGGHGLAAYGIDVRGRSTVLRLNYRTTEQIRRRADQILGAAGDDLDGGKERRDLTRSLMSGPEPRLVACASRQEELTEACKQVQSWIAHGLQPSAIAIFGRTKRVLDRVQEILRGASIDAQPLSDKSELTPDSVRVGTMHRAKGLEFKAVVVLGCSALEVPHAAVLDQCSDPQDRENAEAGERRLLYVAMTRARDELVVLWSGAPSPFLQPLLTG
jgi:Txe/YoeB family toxin of Txe-Axe toxin-antitoxin module